MLVALAVSVLPSEVTGAVDLFPRDFRVVPVQIVYLTPVVLQVKVHLVAVTVMMSCPQIGIADLSSDLSINTQTLDR